MNNASLNTLSQFKICHYAAYYRQVSSNEQSYNLIQFLSQYTIPNFPTRISQAFPDYDYFHPHESDDSLDFSFIPR